MIEEMQLLRLSYCATSNRLGVPDQGFPETMRELAALGLVTLVAGGNGAWVTPEGHAYLHEHRQLLKRI